MNIAMSLLVGAILGWATCSFLGFNEARGKLLSSVIGAFGGVIGGKELAPVFSTAVAGEISMNSMLFALAVAAAFLAVSHVMNSLWDV